MRTTSRALFPIAACISIFIMASGRLSAQLIRVYVNGKPVELRAAGVKVLPSDRITIELPAVDRDCYKSLLIWKYVEDLKSPGQQQQQQQAQQRFSSKSNNTDRDEVVDEIGTLESTRGLKKMGKTVPAKRVKTNLVYAFTLNMLSPKQNERIYTAIKVDSPCDPDNAENTVFKFYVSK